MHDLLVCLPAYTGLSRVYTLQHCDSFSPVLQCHVTHDLPNYVSLVVLHVCVGVDSGRDAEPRRQTSPRAGSPPPPIGSCPISPWSAAVYAHIGQWQGPNTAFLDNTQVFSASRQKALPFNYTQANVVWYVSIFPA